MLNRMLIIAASLSLLTFQAIAETAEFTIKDDPEIDKLVSEVRKDYLSKRAQRQPGFTKLDITVLVPDEDGNWKRGSHGGDTLHYPASTVKLAYMAAAAHWERVNNKPIGFLEPHVGPMIRRSDNVATGRVVDAITSTTNWNGEPGAPQYEEWKAARMYTMDYLSTRGLLENQVIHVKTYPTNSGPMPAGYEERMWKELGRNLMNTRANASLLLEIVKGKLEPRSTQYMRGLLTHDPRGSDSVLGFGVPPGAIYENKTGRAYDTLADFAYIKLPGNNRELVIAVLSNAFIDSEPDQPRPYNNAVLGVLAETLIERLGLDKGAPPKVKRDNSDATYFSSDRDWVTSSTALEKWGSDYLVSAGAAGLTTATWNLKVPESGLWEVCIWYPQDAALAADAPFVVRHDQGESKIHVDQRTRGGRWVKLGDFEMEAGTGQVSVSNAIDDKAKSVAADAVKATMWPAGAAKPSVADDAITSASVAPSD